ncbi:DUF5989 family protein [Desulfocicer vacuolatum]
MKDLWEFMVARKKFWLAPVLILMLLVGSLAFFSQGSVIAPFIYALF